MFILFNYDYSSIIIPTQASKNLMVKLNTSFQPLTQGRFSLPNWLSILFTPIKKIARRSSRRLRITILLPPPFYSKRWNFISRKWNQEIGAQQ